MQIPSTDGWVPSGFPYFTADDPLRAIAPPLPANLKSRLIPCSVSVPLHPVLFVCDSSERRSQWIQSISAEHFQAVDSTSEAFLSYSKTGSVEVSVIIFDVTSCRTPIPTIFSIFRQDYPNIPVILIGRDGMDCIKTEDYPEYLVGGLPEFDWALLLPIIVSGLRINKTIQEKNLIAHSMCIPIVSSFFLGKSPAALRFIQEIREAALQDDPVFLEGEPGMYKETAALFIHLESSRVNAPFGIAINNRGIRDIYEAYLFGIEPHTHESYPEGLAGRIELANHGTIFIDNIDFISLSTQERLLFYLKTRSFYRINARKPRISDTKIIVSSQTDVKTLAEEGVFSHELLKMLSGITIQLPAVREMVETIPTWIHMRSEALAGMIGKEPPEFTAAAVEKMMEYSWPGNLEEFERTMRQIIFRNKSGSVPPEEVVFAGLPGQPSKTSVDFHGMPLSDVEKHHLLATLAAQNGNRASAAKVLGISERTLYNKLREYGNE